jgi:hypothetical protein
MTGAWFGGRVGSTQRVGKLVGRERGVRLPEIHCKKGEKADQIPDGLAKNAGSRRRRNQVVLFGLIQINCQWRLTINFTDKLAFIGHEPAVELIDLRSGIELLNADLVLAGPHVTNLKLARSSVAFGCFRRELLAFTYIRLKRYLEYARGTDLQWLAVAHNGASHRYVGLPLAAGLKH